jgi:hypothetical protein
MDFMQLLEVDGGSQAGYPRVSERIQQQVATGGPKQAQITIGAIEGEAFRGEVTVTHEGNEYRLYKGDTHSCWAVHQSKGLNLNTEEGKAKHKARLEAFTALWKALTQTV